MDGLYLNTDAGTTQCKVHPVVIFSILDAFVRRPDFNSTRVVGTLLGTNVDGIVEIKNCFPVPLKEDGKVDAEFYKTMKDLHKTVSPKEVIIGWFATGSDIDGETARLHDSFTTYQSEAIAAPSKEVAAHLQDSTLNKEFLTAPVHLLVDTTLKTKSISIKAYTTSTIKFGEKVLGSQFLPLPVEMIALNSEKIAVDVLIKSKNNPKLVMRDLENLESSVGKLIEMIEDVTAYVNKVVEHKAPADNTIGRFLADAVASLPKLDSASMEKLFTNNLQDLLMIIYLGNLTRTQLSLAEKLQKVM